VGSFGLRDGIEAVKGMAKRLTNSYQVYGTYTAHIRQILAVPTAEVRHHDSKGRKRMLSADLK
jgi:hypothetical protein